ncbi:MAG: tRNA pseudouridine(38-40) synthase TruA [Candidatus Margulisiibacteriota bacterium]
MRTVKLTLQYDGVGFYGFQKQKANENTVQQCLEDVLSRIFRQNVFIRYAGRTDRGVHAKSQIIVFSDEGRIPLDKLRIVLNRCLSGMRVTSAQEVESGFDPRRSAHSRQYEYWMYEGAPSVFLDRHMLHVEELDISLLNEVACRLLGWRDCKYLCHQPKQYVRTERCINSVVFERVPFNYLGYAGHAIRMTIEANSFLQHMVRRIVGLLLSVGFGKLTVEDYEDVINGRARHAWKMVPAKALYLSKVEYTRHELVFGEVETSEA